MIPRYMLHVIFLPCFFSFPSRIIGAMSKCENTNHNSNSNNNNNNNNSILGTDWYDKPENGRMACISESACSYYLSVSPDRGEGEERVRLFVRGEG